VGVPPHDLPPRSAVYYFAKWRDDGTAQAIHDLPRWHAREEKGRTADPTLVVLGTQSVRAVASVPADTTGKGLHRLPGRAYRRFPRDVDGYDGQLVPCVAGLAQPGCCGAARLAPASGVSVTWRLRR
jgi:hypothetical protein